MRVASIYHPEPSLITDHSSQSNVAPVVSNLSMFPHQATQPSLGLTDIPVSASLGLPRNHSLHSECPAAPATSLLPNTPFHSHGHGITQIKGRHTLSPPISANQTHGPVADSSYSEWYASVTPLGNAVRGWRGPAPRKRHSPRQSGRMVHYPRDGGCCAEI